MVVGGNPWRMPWKPQQGKSRKENCSFKWNGVVILLWVRDANKTTEEAKTGRTNGNALPSLVALPTPHLFGQERKLCGKA